MIEVIDDFLDNVYFDSLVTLITDKDKTGNMSMPWYFQSSVSDHGLTEDNLFYMIHMVYEMNSPTSPLYENFLPLLDKLEVKSLMRIQRVN